MDADERKVVVALVCASVIAGAAAASCRLEQRPLREPPPAGSTAGRVRQVELQAGPAEPRAPVVNPYEGDPNAVREGRRLYDWYNCSGCHFNGGGGIGPPLMDDAWIYGGDADQIFDTIVEGRANGMPAYGGRIPDFQVWQIVAYVRSMSDLAPEAEAAGARREGLQEEADHE